MKKILVIIVGVLSFLIVFTSFNEVNVNHGNKLHVAEETMAKYAKKPIHYVYINYDDFDFMINSLMKFGNEHDVSFIAFDEYKDNKCLYTIKEYSIYTKDEQLLDCFDIDIKDKIDFSVKETNKYYTTEKDNNSSGQVHILDNKFFDQQLEIYRFKSFGKLHRIDNSTIFLKIICNQDTLNELTDYLDSVNDSFVVDDHTESVSDVILEDDKDIIGNQAKELMKVGILIFVVVLAVIILNKNRSYMIQRMMGTSVFRIVFNEFGRIFVFLWFEFIAVNVGSFFILCREPSNTKWQFFSDIVLFNLVFLGMMLFVLLLSCVFIYTISSVKYINNDNQINKLFYLQIIFKVAITVLLLVPIINAVNEAKPYLFNYFTVKEMESQIDGLYALEYIPERSEEIFNYYYDQAMYADFTTYYNNYSTLRYDDVTEDDVYPYPMIKVNDNYLKEYKDLYDLDGNKIDLSKIESDTIFVPKSFKGGDLKMYQRKGESVIYIEDNGKYLNYKLQEPFFLNDPIIYLERTYNYETQIQSMFFKPSDVVKLQNELYGFSDDESEMKLISCQYRYNYFNDNLKRQLIEFSLIFIIYAVMFMILTIQSILIYFNERGKFIAVGYTLGHSIMKRYLDLFITNIVSYIGIFIAGLKLDVSYHNCIIFVLGLVTIEIMVEICYIKYHENKKIVSWLKGEK